MRFQDALKPFRLKLYFTNKYCYAQIIRQNDGNVVAAASTLEKTFRESLERTSDKAAASVVGKILAARALEQDIKGVHWPREKGQKYHGKIAAVIDAMKAEGLPLV